MEALKIEGLCKNFGGLQVLRHVSLVVEVGERAVIIGPKGAGKTTLLSIVTGGQFASGGRVHVFGQEITNMPAHRRVHFGLSCSFQINQLFLNLTVLDNMLLSLHGLKASRYQMFRRNTAYGGMVAKAQELLESIDLWDKRNEPVQAISYGEQRKMEIVLAIASDPRLLVMDEPTAGLSLDEVPAFINTIKAMSAGTTVLFTSHDMDVVFGLATRVVVLHYGQLIAQGTPDEIRSNSKVMEIYLGIRGDSNIAEAG